MDTRIAPPFMEATDASRLVCVVVVSIKNAPPGHARSFSVKVPPLFASRERVRVVSGGDNSVRSPGRAEAQAAASLRPRRVDTPRHLDLLSCATVYAAAASGRHRERYIVHNTKNGAQFEK